MSKRLMYGVVALALLCAFLSGWNVWLYQSYRGTTSQIRALSRGVHAEDVARQAARKAKQQSAVATYERCVTAIKFTQEANLVVETVRGNSLGTAETAEKLAATDTSEQARQVHLAAAKASRARARELKPFPVGTKARCRSAARGK